MASLRVGIKLSDTDRFVPPCSWERCKVCKGRFNLRGTTLHKYVKHAHQQLASSLCMTIIFPQQTDHLCFLLKQPERRLNVDKPVEGWPMHYSMDQNLRFKKKVCKLVGIYTQQGKSESLLDNIGRARVRIWQVNGISGASPTDPCWSKTWRSLERSFARVGNNRS